MDLGIRRHPQGRRRRIRDQGMDLITSAKAQTKLHSQIHVDRYKYSVLTSLSDNDLQSLGTRDETSTRFHACERFDRCDHISHHEQTVVYVNPVLLGVTAWEAYLHQTVNRLEAGEQVRTLVCQNIVLFVAPADSTFSLFLCGVTLLYQS